VLIEPIKCRNAESERTAVAAPESEIERAYSLLTLPIQNGVRRSAY